MTPRETNILVLARLLREQLELNGWGASAWYEAVENLESNLEPNGAP